MLTKIGVRGHVVVPVRDARLTYTIWGHNLIIFRIHELWLVWLVAIRLDVWALVVRRWFAHVHRWLHHDLVLISETHLWFLMYIRLQHLLIYFLLRRDVIFLRLLARQGVNRSLHFIFNLLRDIDKDAIAAEDQSLRIKREFFRRFRLKFVRSASFECWTCCFLLVILQFIFLHSLCLLAGIHDLMKGHLAWVDAFGRDRLFLGIGNIFRECK